MSKAPETWGGKIWLGYKIGEGRYKGGGTALPRSPQSPPAPSSPANPAFTAILARRQPSPITGPLTTREKEKTCKEQSTLRRSRLRSRARCRAGRAECKVAKHRNGRRSTNLFQLLQRLLVDTALLKVILRCLHDAIDDLRKGGALLMLVASAQPPGRSDDGSWARGACRY